MEQHYRYLVIQDIDKHKIMKKITEHKNTNIISFNQKNVIKNSTKNKIEKKKLYNQKGERQQRSKKVESYYRLQYEILRLIDDGKISEAQQYLWKKVHQQDTDALAIIGFLYFYGVGLKKDEQKGKKILQEAVQKGNVVAADFIKNIE